MSSGKLHLTRPIDYPAKQFDVLAPQGSLNISSSQLITQDPVTISGTIFSHYLAENLTAGEDLS